MQVGSKRYFRAHSSLLSGNSSRQGAAQTHSPTQDLLNHSAGLSREFVHSYPLQGPPPACFWYLRLSSSFLAYYLVILVVTQEGWIRGSGGLGCVDDLLNSVASCSSTRLPIRGCGLGHAGHSAALWWVLVCASSPLLSIQGFPVAV